MPLSSRASRRVAAMNVGMVKSTCLRRSAVLVVDPHSRSISCDVSAEILLDDDTGTYLTVRLLRFNSRLMASVILTQISTEYPMACRSAER